MLEYVAAQTCTDMESTLLLHYNSVDNSPNVRMVVSDILEQSLCGRLGTKSSVVPPNKLTSTRPGQRLAAVIEWPRLGELSGSVTWS